MSVLKHGVPLRLEHHRRPVPETSHTSAPISLSLCWVWWWTDTHTNNVPTKTAFPYRVHSLYTMRRYSRGNTRVLERMGVPSAHALQQRRQLWPMIVGGMAVFAAGTVLNYGYRALKAMENQKDDSGEGSTSSSTSGDDVAATEDSTPTASSTPSTRTSCTPR